MHDAPSFSNPSFSQEPDYSTTNLSQLSMWGEWARQRLTRDQMELQRLREENAQLHQTKERLDEHLSNTTRQVIEISSKCNDIEKVVEGFRSLEKLRKTIRVFEIGARVTVIPAEVIGKVRKVIIDPSGTYY